MIGAHIVRACLERGWATRALVRATSDRRNLDALPVQIAEGDLHDPASIARALEDCDLLLHAAAPYPRRHFGKAALIASARESMENLLATWAAHCRALGRGRMVYVSSVTTLNPVRDSAPYFELKQMLEALAMEAADPGRSGARTGAEASIEARAQSATEAGAEARAQSATEARTEARTEAGKDIVVVNPTFCIDEFDTNLTTAQLLLPLARRQLPAYLPGRLNAVATRDVGEGVALAAEHGHSGSRYVLGGENLTSGALLERCARVAGVPAPRRTMPIPLAEALSMVTEVVAYATRTRPLFPMTGIRMIKHGQAVDIRTTREELGYEPSSLDEAIGRAYDWYRREGHL